jgi:hypothetical protein
MLENFSPVGNSSAGHEGAHERLRAAADLTGVSAAQGEPAKAKFGKKKMMQLGELVPFHATGGDLVRDYAQCPEATGYDFLAAPEIDASPPRSWRGFC